jgi:SAM-dependent methyltransferase
VYGPLAASLVRASPIDLTGKLVLDIGSGTGTVACALDDMGASVVVADCTLGMVVHGHRCGWKAIASDAMALGVRDGAFDAAMAGFLLNHLPPAVALTEMARVVRAGGVVAASTWASAPPDPIKEATNTVLRAWGWRPPAWYETMKSTVEPVSGVPGRLMGDAARAGLVDVRATVVDQDLGLSDPGDIVAYRLAMPHIAPWVARLGEPVDPELVQQLRTAIAPYVPGWRISVIQLTARVPAHPR